VAIYFMLVFQAYPSSRCETKT